MIDPGVMTMFKLTTKGRKFNYGKFLSLDVRGCTINEMVKEGDIGSGYFPFRRLCLPLSRGYIPFR